MNTYKRNVYRSICHNIYMFIFYKLYKITILINRTNYFLLFFYLDNKKCMIKLIV